MGQAGRESGAERIRLVFAMAAVLLIGATSAAAAPSERLAPTPTGFGRDGDQMGSSVAVLGDLLVAGSPNAQPTFSVDSGAAQVFRNGAAGWAREAVLVPSHMAAEQRFGASVAIGDGIVAVGASGSLPETLVYRYDGSQWIETDDLTFGGIPAISGDTLAVGGGSAVRLYEDQGGTWVAQADVPVDGDPTMIEAVKAVFLSGDTLAFMTAKSGFGSLNALALYFFHRADGVWTRDTKLDLGSYFGTTTLPAVALSGDSAILSSFDSADVLTRGDGAWGVSQSLDAGIPWSELGPSAVALDGDRAVVACNGQFVMPATQGSAIVFENSGGAWSRVSRPYDVEGAPGDTFGSSAALSGTTLAVGAPGAPIDGVASGKVVPFVVGGAAWSADPALGEGNAHAGEHFGTVVAMSGSSAFVTSMDTTFRIVVHDFEVEGQQWVEQAQLDSPSANPYASFGLVIALDGDTAVIDSRNDRSDDAHSWDAVYVYARGAAGWDVSQRIESDTPDNEFGFTLALDGDGLAIGDPNHRGAPGRVVMYARSGGTWTPQATIQPDDSAPYDEFGTSLALSGNTVAVGEPGADAGIETNAGAAYVFTDAGGIWQQQARLTAPVPLQNRGFGASVAIAGDTLVVGGERTAGADGDAAYVFERDGDTWTYVTALSIPGANENDFQSGFSLALSEDASVAVIGAPNSVGSVFAGTAYVYRRAGSTWSLAASLHGLTYPQAYDSFGNAISISGSDAIIAAPSESPGGAAYVVPVGETVFANGFD
jgi:hypothetical protein